jgi:hypothetical protein
MVDLTGYPEKGEALIWSYSPFAHVQQGFVEMQLVVVVFD